MKYLEENYKFLIFVIVIGLIGGIFSSIYLVNSISKELLESALKQVSSKEIIILIGSIQCFIYTIIFSVFGIILSNKIGLWKKIVFEKKKILISIIISIIGGLFLILGDLLIFGNYNEMIRNSYNLKPSLEYIISSITYGGVFEEVMIRLFLMSLIAFIISKIFYKKEIPNKVFIISNIICALLFALCHLPSTNLLFGELNTLLIIRCMIMNGTFGLIFGWLYRKYGIHYSMFVHIGVHIVSKIIWLLFI